MPKAGRPSSRARDDYLFNTPLQTPFGTLLSQPQRVKIVGGKYVPRTDEPFVPSAREGDAPGRTPPHLKPSPTTDRNGINPHNVLPAINSGGDAEVPSDLGDIYDKLPRDSVLSSEPLLLSKSEEDVVLRELHRQLKFLAPAAVKSAYRDLMRVDHSNSGYIAFQDLKMILVKNMIRLPLQLFRVLGCAHVSRIEPGRVCYSKILSFILLVLDPRDGPEEVEEAPQVRGSKAQELQLRDPPVEPSRPPPAVPTEPASELGRILRSDSPSPRRSPLTVADTQRSLQQVSNQLPTNINIETLRNAFGRADRTRRGTLSELQIREICGEVLRIGKDTVDRLLQHVPLRGGSQYNWQALLDLLERIQPVSTGLFIPPSKRPLEYARSYRQPAASWPAAESPTLPPDPGQDLVDARTGPAVNYHYSDAGQSFYHPDSGMYYLPQLSAREEGPPPPPMPPSVTELPPSLPAANQQPPVQNNASPPGNHRNANEDFRPPEPTLPDSIDLYSEPWHSRFMRLAQHLYNQDSRSRGLLPEDKILHFTLDCNTCYRLNLHEGQINDALSRNRQGSEVNLHGYLMRLAMTH